MKHVGGAVAVVVVLWLVFVVAAVNTLCDEDFCPE
jgi:hypothetical protein